jgi:hypothetical protein
MLTRLVVSLVVVALAAAEAGAQTTTTTVNAPSAGDALYNILLGSESSNTGAVSFPAAAAVEALILGETTSFPIGSSAGGFTWTFDTNLRVPVRRSQSFGPMFAERPFTVGKSKLNVGFIFQHTSFTSVGNQPLDNIESLSTYNFGAEVYRWTSSMDVTIDRAIVSATYGVHDRVDLGVIVPVGRASVSGYGTKYELIDTGITDELENSSGSSFGIGDIVVRGKAALMDTPDFSTALALDLRLPTGSTNKLMGAGAAQAKVLFIAGATRGNVNPHVNVGYVFGGKGLEFDENNIGGDEVPALIDSSPSPEFDYTLGADVAVTPKVTVAGDVIGRVVRNTANMNRFDSGAGEADRYILMEVTPGTVHKLLGAVGAKVSLGGTWLLTGTVLFPLNSKGVKSTVTPVIGLERAF